MLLSDESLFREKKKYIYCFSFGVDLMYLVSKSKNVIVKFFKFEFCFNLVCKFDILRF